MRTEDVIAAEVENAACTHEVHVIAILEVGDRARGLAYPKCGYDIRFVYAKTASGHMPKRKTPNHMMLTSSPDLTIRGRELRVFMRDMQTPDTYPFTWLAAPTLKNRKAWDNVRHLGSDCFAPRAYANAARNRACWMRDLCRRLGQVTPDAYLDEAHRLLSAKWALERHEMPPLDFHALRDQCPEGKRTKTAIDSLVTDKMCGIGNMHRPPQARVERWLESIIEEIDELLERTPAWPKEQAT